jgi:hypothetical protein
LKTLYIDIETAPIKAYVWGLWDQNVGLNQIIQPTHMLSFAAKWQGERRTHFHSIHHDGKRAMIRAAHALLDDADVLVTWNGKKFDEKHLSREFMEQRLAPPSPYKSLDLFETAKSRFYFPSNKLEYVGALLTDKAKLHTDFSLWTSCMAGDEKAWAKMKRYNIRDVALLEEVHEKFLPWIKSAPNAGLYTDGEVCPRCGKTDTLTRRGGATTLLGVYRRYQCKSCGGWSRGKFATKLVNVRAI